MQHEAEGFVTSGRLRGRLVTLLLIGTAGSAFALETTTLSPMQHSWINSASTSQWSVELSLKGRVLDREEFVLRVKR